MWSAMTSAIPWISESLVVSKLKCKEKKRSLQTCFLLFMSKIRIKLSFSAPKVKQWLRACMQGGRKKKERARQAWQDTSVQHNKLLSLVKDGHSLCVSGCSRRCSESLTSCCIWTLDSSHHRKSFASCINGLRSKFILFFYCTLFMKSWHLLFNGPYSPILLWASLSAPSARWWCTLSLSLSLSQRSQLCTVCVCKCVYAPFPLNRPLN